MGVESRGLSERKVLLADMRPLDPFQGKAIDYVLLSTYVDRSRVRRQPQHRRRFEVPRVPKGTP